MNDNVDDKLESKLLSFRALLFFNEHTERARQRRDDDVFCRGKGRYLQLALRV